LSPDIRFILWVIALAALLFYPASKLIWVFSVRRLQRKLGRGLSDEEINAQRNRARVIAAFVVLLFSVLYNLKTLGVPGGG
jgi:hypothetical protein